MRPFETEKVRCTGHCCRAFFLPYSYEQLQAKKADGSLRARDEQVPDMVIPLGQYENLPVELKAIVPPGSDSNDHYYTCKNYDTATGNCKVYETRPHMCSDYPYGSSCKYMGCTRKTECDRASMDQLSKEIKAVEQVLKPYAKMGASWGARCRQWLASCWRS